MSSKKDPESTRLALVFKEKSLHAHRKLIFVQLCNLDGYQCFISIGTIFEVVGGGLGFFDLETWFSIKVYHNFTPDKQERERRGVKEKKKTVMTFLFLMSFNITVNKESEV